MVALIFSSSAFSQFSIILLLLFFHDLSLILVLLFFNHNPTEEFALNIIFFFFPSCFYQFQKKLSGLVIISVSILG